MKNFTLSILLLACSACSTMEFNSTGNETIKVSASREGEIKSTVEVTKDFLFWGMSPELAEFDLQEEMRQQGFNKPSGVTIESRYTFKDIFFTFITLGLYCPVTYQVTLLSERDVR